MKNTTIIAVLFLFSFGFSQIISVSPDSLYSALFTGETDTQTLTITNDGGSDLHFSINLLNVNTRPHVNIEPGNRPTLSIQDVQDFWNSDHEYSSSGSGRPGTTTPTRTTRSWQLLANDPQDNNSPYDTENIYYEVTDTSLNFKYEYYEPWEDAEGNTVAMVLLNIDNDTETGETIEEYELIWEGIDAIIYSIGLDDFEDGIYLYTEDYYGYGEFVFYEPLAWRVAEDNTNEFSFAVSNELFQGLTSSRIVSLSGSFNYDPDTVPNEGMLDLYFRPAWLSIEPLDSVITVGSALDLSVTFDAAGLFGGDYHALIQINSNDPSTPEFDLPTHLSVTGAPNINVETDSIDFGVTYTNFGGTEQISIGNNGTDVLEVSSITVDNDVFSLSESNATIGYGDEFILEVEFLPLESGDHSGTITIVSNDSNEPEITIVLVGNSIAPPVINVSPDSLYSALTTGETETQIMTILNNGMSDLEYDINIYGSADGDPYALGFNGSSNYVSFDNQTIQSMIGGNWANEKTISAWIKPVGSSPNISGGWGGDAIYGQASGSGNFFGISRGIIGGEDRIWVYNWDGNDDRIGIEYENFEWVHIALVQDNGVLYGYKNGELIGQVNTGASGTAGYQRIGGGTDNGGYFQGFLDEIRIWSVARTQDEIQSNASHELSGDEDNLVGYWKFNEGAGTLVNDETAGENHGSVFGATWILSDAVVYTSWIGVSPANGIIVPGASSDINLEINAQGFDAGTYTTSLLINSNDPVSPVINIPATLEIEFLGNDNAGLIPAEFALYQNYPNPFNPITTIRFDIPVETYHNTSLRIYDITGRVVETLVNEKLEPGQHEIQWNASQHSSGVYFLRMNAISFIKTQKMILLK